MNEEVWDQDLSLDGVQLETKMIRLLREKKSGLYYKGSGEWTPHKKNAFEFKDNQSAIACGRRLKWPAVELIFKFSGFGRDVAFPLV